MLTKKDLSEKFKISLPTIDRLMVQGMPYIKIGKSVRFELDEVMKWIKKE